MLIRQEWSGLSEPCVSSLDDPPTLEAAPIQSVFVMLCLRPSGMVPTVGCLASSVVRVRGPSRRRGRRSPVSAFPHEAFVSGGVDLFEREIRKHSLFRRGAFKPNSQWKTLTVDLAIQAVHLPHLVLATARFAGATLPSRNASPQCISPCPSKKPGNVGKASSPTSCLFRCFKCHEQVAGEGYLSRRTARPSSSKAPRERLPGIGGSMHTDDRDHQGGNWILAIAVQLGPPRIYEQFESKLAYPSREPIPTSSQEVPALGPNLFMKQTLGSSDELLDSVQRAGCSQFGRTQ